MFSMRVPNMILAGSLAMGLLAPPACAGNEAVVYSFAGDPGDGGYPVGGLIDVGGTLYGTTEFGGTDGMGTVFALTPAGVETVLYSFGTGSPDDGALPQGGLIDVGGVLYGTTNAGGTYGDGTVFSVTTAGVETVLYSFQGGSDGNDPGGLINVGGTLYGTTGFGGGTGCGGFGCGTVFSVTTAGDEGVLHSFCPQSNCSDGTFPNAGLVDVGGVLYGTTYAGGAANKGTVFSVTTAGVETVLHSFGSGRDGVQPEAGLINVDGTLYGTTLKGGATALGTVFAVTTAGVETVLHSFGVPPFVDGFWPQAGLIDVGGTLYGTTCCGGIRVVQDGVAFLLGWGTVFAVNTGGEEKVLYPFESNPDGAYPLASLIAVDGMLYGTTAQGGTTGNGTVFKVAPLRMRPEPGTVDVTETETNGAGAGATSVGDQFTAPASACDVVHEWRDGHEVYGCRQGTH